MGHAMAAFIFFVVGTAAFVLGINAVGDKSHTSIAAFLVFLFFMILLFVLLPYALAFHFLSMWRSEKRERILNKVKNKAFLESGSPLSWYEQKILGRYVVEKMNSGQLLHEMKEENEYAEDALTDLAAQHRPKR